MLISSCVLFGPKSIKSLFRYFNVSVFTAAIKSTRLFHFYSLLQFMMMKYMVVIDFIFAFTDNFKA